jgi:periplasmic protein TonB
MTPRRHVRHVVTPRLYVAINGSSSGGILHDVSDGGVSLDVVGAPPADKRVLLDFDMSETGEHFEGFGQVIWNNESKNRVGFQFVDLPDTSRNKVRNWLSAKSASRGTLQNMVVQDRTDATGVEIPAGLRQHTATSASVALEPLEKEPAVPVAASRTAWRTELERVVPSETTTDSPSTEEQAEPFTDLGDLDSKDGPKEPTRSAGVSPKATTLGWTTASAWNEEGRWILWVAIICLAIIFLGLGIRILKTRGTYHTVKSFFANLWSPAVPAHLTSPKTSTPAPPSKRPPQTADKITDLRSGNRPPAINQFEVMDAQNGRRYLPRTGTNVVIQADKSRPTQPANTTAPSAPTSEAKAGRVSQRSSGELPVVGAIPEYPTFALQTNVQGRVVLKAIISTDGTLNNVRLVSPPSLLDSTVLDAVKKWRYQPHYEHGKPLEVETQITVDFSITTE